MSGSTAPATRRQNPNLSKFLEVYGIIFVVIAMMLVLAAIKPEVFLSAQIHAMHEVP